MELILNITQNKFSGIQRLVFVMNFIMQMRTGSEPGASHFPDFIATFYKLAFAYINLV